MLNEFMRSSMACLHLRASVSRAMFFPWSQFISDAFFFFFFFPRQTPVVHYPIMPNRWPSNKHSERQPPTHRPREVWQHTNFYVSRKSQNLEDQPCFSERNSRNKIYKLHITRFSLQVSENRCLNREPLNKRRPFLQSRVFTTSRLEPKESFRTAANKH